MSEFSQRETSNWVIRREPISNSAEEEYYDVIVHHKDDPSKDYRFISTLVRGMSTLRVCPSSRWEKINEGIRYRNDDIMITSFPKCGTTWTEQIVMLLLANGDYSKLNPFTKNAYDQATKFGKVWPESMLYQDAEVSEKLGPQFASYTFEDFDAMPSPRVLKNHLPVHLTFGMTEHGVEDLPPGMKIVVVTRNPLDACVSSYYHASNPFKNGWPFDAWASLWLDGTYNSYGCYFQWVKQWYAEYVKYPDRIIWVQYEELKKDPLTEIDRIARHVNLPLPEPLTGVEISPSQREELYQKVLEYSSFTKMKELASAKGNGKADEHLRKGKVGDWKNHFTNPVLLAEYKEKQLKEFEGLPLHYSFEL